MKQIHFHGENEFPSNGGGKVPKNKAETQNRQVEMACEFSPGTKENSTSRKVIIR